MIFTMVTFAWSSNYLAANLDSDKELEKVAWKSFATTDAGIYYQIFVYDDDGSLLWKGPRTRNEESPYLVASLDYGVSFPELLMDIDGDGRMELLIPALQSDVSTTWYHRLKWVDRSFQPMKSAVLEFRFGAHNDRVQWTVHPRQPYTYWASQLHKMPNGAIRVQITGYDADDPATPHSGIALIRPAPNGGAVYDWIVPIQRPVLNGEYGQTSIPAISAPTPHPYPTASYSSQEYKAPSIPEENYSASRTINYIARLSRADHFNSRGVRLNSINDILRQDRANYHKGHADPEDENDEYFINLAQRTEMEHYRVVPVGTDYRSLRYTILNKTPVVQVRVDHDTFYLCILRP